MLVLFTLFIRPSTSRTGLSISLIFSSHHSPSIMYIYFFTHSITILPHVLLPIPILSYLYYYHYLAYLNSPKCLCHSLCLNGWRGEWPSHFPKSHYNLTLPNDLANLSLSLKSFLFYSMVSGVFNDLSHPSRYRSQLITVMLATFSPPLPFIRFILVSRHCRQWKGN